MAAENNEQLIDRYAEWANALGMTVAELANRDAAGARWEEERRAEKEAEYRRLAAYVKRHPWDSYMSQRLEDFWPRIDAPKQKKVEPMTITKTKGDPVDVHELTMAIINRKAEELRKRDPSLTCAQAFTKVYTDRENSDLVNAERHSNGIYQPRELESLKSVVKAARALPEMMDLRPRTLGDYATGSRSINQDLDTGWPSEEEIARLYDEMKAAGRDGRNFDRAAAAYMAAQARVEAAGREASGVR